MLGGGASVIRLRSKVKRILGDTLTPVSIYLRLRDRFPQTVLLESADYQPGENCFTFICVAPIASFSAARGRVRERGPRGQREATMTRREEVLAAFDRFCCSFEVQADDRDRVISNGLFGYLAYDAVEHFEDIHLGAERESRRDIPDIYYSAYQFIIAINHYKHEMFILENECLDGAPGTGIARTAAAGSAISSSIATSSSLMRLTNEELAPFSSSRLTR